jgi:hypothetical protein
MLRHRGVDAETRKRRLVGTKPFRTTEGSRLGCTEVEIPRVETRSEFSRSEIRRASNIKTAAQVCREMQSGACLALMEAERRRCADSSRTDSLPETQT